MTRRGQDWTDLALEDASPQLAVGWRPRHQHLEAARVELDTSVGDALRDIAVTTARGLADREAIPYSTYAIPSAGEEYLTLPRTDLALSGGDEATDEVAVLLRLLADSNALSVIHANQLREGNFLFYAVVLQLPDGEQLIFAKQQNPTGVLRRAALFGQLSGTLRKVEKPDLAFAFDFDVVITGDEVVVLNKTAFDRLFNDLELTAAQVPADVDRLRTALAGAVDLSPAAAEALQNVCERRPSYARRLHRLAEQQAFGSLDATTFRTALQNHGEAAGDFLDADDRLSVSETRVGDLLDILEERWWTSDFTEERRRADAFRRRQ